MRSMMFYVLLFICLLKHADSSSQIGEWATISNTSEENYKKDIMTANELRLQAPDSARTILLGLLQKSWREGNAYGLRKCLVVLSCFIEDPNLYEQTLRFAKQGILLCDSQKHKNDLIRLYCNIGSLYSRQARFKEAFDANLKATQYAQGDPLEIAGIENNMSDLLALLGQPNLAIVYLERTLKTAILYQDDQLLALALLNLSRLKEDNTKNNFIYIDSSMSVARRFKRYNTLYRGMINKSSILARNNRPRQALQLLKAADTVTRYTFIPTILQSKANEIAGTAYTMLGQYNTAEQKFRESLRQTDEYGWLSSMNHLTNLYVAEGNFVKAYHTYRPLMERLDTIARKEMSLKIHNLEAQYRSAEKDKQLTEQKFLLTKKENTIKLKNIWMGIVAVGGLIALAMVFLMHRNYAQKQKIQISRQDNLQLRARLEGEERERKRISRELHDGIGGILSAAKMNLTGAYPIVGERASKYERGIHLLDDAYLELRRTAHNLSPHILKSKGLAAALESYCKKTAEAQLMDIQLHISGEMQQWDDEMGLTVYRVVQELLQNIVKHSGASKAMVQIGCQQRLLDITVEDNGKGFPEKKTGEGIGLSNIRDRIKALKGDLEIDSRPDEGTTIFVFIPLEQSIQQT